MHILVISPNYPLEELSSFRKLCVSVKSLKNFADSNEIDVKEFSACIVDVQQTHGDGIDACHWLADQTLSLKVFIFNRLNSAFSLCVKHAAQLIGLAADTLPDNAHAKYIIQAYDQASTSMQSELANLGRNSLHQAISNGEFYPVYQPKYALHSKRCIGLEILGRWCPPQKEPISPALFIPMLDKLNLHKMYNQWLFKQVLMEVSTLEKASPAIAFNLSVNHLQDIDTCQYIMNCLGYFGFPPEKLTVEVTEDTLMSGQENALVALSLLKDIGVQISLDDFGTGYSSLQQLISFQFNEIKLDQCFLRGVPGNKQNQIILETTITLAQKFDTKLILEGIETKEQEVFARRLGGQFGQGFYYSKPLDIKMLSTFLRCKNS